MISIFSSNHNEIGSIDKNLILKTLGKIRILWGKKFIDLLDKDGNINSGLKNIINQVSSEDLIKNNGFYYLDEALIAYVGGEKVILSSESGNTFVSFLVEQDTTDEQKKIALKNIGFYYDTKKDINITNGIAYVEDEGTIYIIYKGNITKLSASIPNPYPNLFVISKEDLNNNGSLVITGSGETNSIMFDTLSIFSDNGAIYKSNLHKFFVGNNLVCQINNEGIITESIQSENASTSNGYRIFNREGNYILEIDNIVVRNGIPKDIDLTETTYYKNLNIISSVKKINSSTYRCYLNKYNNRYNVGDKLLVYINNNKILTPVILTVTGISTENSLYVDVTSSTNIENISGLLCLLIDYDLVAGKLDLYKYNSKEHGIISKLNIFYSAKFDKEGTGNLIYPFYSNELYNELENNINNDLYNKYIIPPYGLLFNLPLKDINKIKLNPNKNNLILLFDNGWKYNKYLVTPLKEINDLELAKPNKDNLCITYTNNKWEYVVQTKYSDFESIPFTSVNYKSLDKKIYFYNKKEEIIGQIDTTDFIKDGMVSNVYIEEENLYITFNTDAGKDTIIIPIFKIFDASKYYNKTEVNNLLNLKVNISDLADVATSGDYNDLKNKPTKVSAFTNDKGYLTEHQSLDNYYTKSEIDGIVGGSLPIGTILMWSGTVAKLPTGFMICDGSLFNTSDNPTLYDILGSNRLPDLRDRFIVGAGNSYNIKDTGGEKEHILTSNELPEHYHEFKDYYYAENEIALLDRNIVNYDKIIINNKGGSGSIDDDNDCLMYYKHKTEKTGIGQAHENRPPYYALYYIIKVSNKEVTPISNCESYDFTNLNATEGYVDNIGSAVALSIKTKDPLIYSEEDSSSWITYITTNSDDTVYSYICKAEDYNGIYREGIAVFKSNDGCVFEATVKQGVRS